MAKTYSNGSWKESLGELYHILHNLSGTGASFGFERITQQARVIEQLVDSLIKHAQPPNPEQKDQITILVFKLLEELENPHEQGSSFVPQVRQGTQRPLIFIVDDDTMFNQKTSIELEAAGYTTKIFERAEDILEEPAKRPRFSWI